MNAIGPEDAYWICSLCVGRDHQDKITLGLGAYSLHELTGADDKTAWCDCPCHWSTTEDIALFKCKECGAVNEITRKKKQ